MPEKTPEAASAGVRFHYLKSPSFRVVHADGVIGGITPTGHLHMAVFSERPAIPQQIVHTLNDDGKLGPELKEQRVSREGIVRDMDFDIVMNLGTAELIRDWLERKIKDLKDALQTSQSKVNE